MPIHIVGPDNRGFLKARAMCGDIVLGPQVGGHSVAHDDRDKGTCPGCRAAAGLPLAEDAVVATRGAVARGVLPPGHVFFVNGKRGPEKYITTGDGEECTFQTWAPSMMQVSQRVGERLPEDPTMAIVTARNVVDRTFTLSYLKLADQ